MLQQRACGDAPASTQHLVAGATAMGKPAAAPVLLLAKEEENPRVSLGSRHSAERDGLILADLLLTLPAAARLLKRRGRC